MTIRDSARITALAAVLAVGFAAPSLAEQTPPAAQASTRKVRVTGVVRDEFNDITLPGVPVEVVGTGEVVYTDVDGRYVLDLRARAPTN